VLDNLIFGFSVAMSYETLMYCFLGVLLGTLVGVLPGLGPLATISILFPLSYTLASPMSAIVFLSGVYYGSQYGGSTTSILLKLPGETSSLITTIDGYEMTKQGRAGPALAIAAIGSFVAGTIVIFLMAAVSEPLAKFVILFGSADYAALMFFGCVGSVFLTQGSVLKSLAMVFLGFLIGSVGVDINSGVDRFTFSNVNLSNGISFIIIILGLVGLVEIVWETFSSHNVKIQISKIHHLYPSIKDLKMSFFPIMRGTIVGAVLGILPGAGLAISSMASYILEKKVSRTPEKFGKGAIEGVAGPESANNAAAQSGFIPALGLGIPTSATMSLMIGILVLYGIQPGPMFISNNPDLFWGLVVSMWVGNLLLLILNLPLIKIWVSILKIPRYILFPIIVAFCIYGTYTINNNWFDVYMLFPFVLLGLLFRYTECDPAPLIMGFILGPMLEENLRRALIISHGEWVTFINRPISLTFIVLTAIIILVTALKSPKIHID
jgi:putative tricarboxylic transport membrane protein